MLPQACPDCKQVDCAKWCRDMRERRETHEARVAALTAEIDKVNAERDAAPANAERHARAAEVFAKIDKALASPPADDGPILRFVRTLAAVRAAGTRGVLRARISTDYHRELVESACAASRAAFGDAKAVPPEARADGFAGTLLNVPLWIDPALDVPLVMEAE